MKIISKEQVNLMHRMLIKEFGGIDGIRDDNLLDSALHNAFQTFDGIDLYPTAVEKAASLCFSLIKNHAYLDGNKRIGILVMLVFLDINECPIECVNEELIEIGRNIANGSMVQRDILAWIDCHLKLER
jgi:death-on-curing protein